MARNNRNKAKRRFLFLGIGSIAIIIVMTLSIGKYWVEIFDKYQEKNELSKELENLKEKEEQLRVDADRLQNPDYIARYAREIYLHSKDGDFTLQIPEEK